MQFSRVCLLLSAVGCLYAAASARTVENLSWRKGPRAPNAEPETFASTHRVGEEPSASAEPNDASWYDPGNKQFHSAVLVAGSEGYQNYRHQADVCHAYQILIANGLLNDHIITMVYDDIAYHPYNPYPGQIFNNPGKAERPSRRFDGAVLDGPNVYPGCAKDYTGNFVNRDTLMAVLSGNAAAVAGIGSGRVLQKNPFQRVFMFYSDHGSVGSVGMPYGSGFTAVDLANSFNYMRANNFFYELVFYLESCDSGSMFQGWGYESTSNILAVSASGYAEASYASYCPPYGIPSSRQDIGACLGDLFSVSWMEYAESNDIATHKIVDQLAYTTMRTSADGTYWMGSHVGIFALPECPILHEPVGNFLSYYNVPPSYYTSDVYLPLTKKAGAHETNAQPINLPQRDADLMFLVQRTMSNDIDVREAATRKLQEELEKRQTADRAIRAVVEYLMDQGLVRSERNGVEDYVMTLLPRDRNLQVVDDWDCFQGCIDAWGKTCGRLNDYSSQYTRAFANLCNSGVKITDFAEAAAIACSANRST